MRVVAATNKDPQQAVASGQLRGDLFYRLNVFNIQMPPLREHRDGHSRHRRRMIDDMNQRHGCPVSGIAPNCSTRLLAYDWPGNARELRNTIERAIVLCGESQLHALVEQRRDEGQVRVRLGVPGVPSDWRAGPLREHRDESVALGQRTELGRHRLERVALGQAMEVEDQGEG